MKNCPNCDRPTDQVKTVIAGNAIHTGCSRCLSTLIQGNELANKNRRTHDQRDHRRSNVQPVEMREFAEAYPEQARELYGDEQMRKLGH